MTKRIEDTITVKARDILGGITHGWTFATQERIFEELKKRSDMVATCAARETIAISAKRHDGNIASAVAEMKNEYLGSELAAKFIGVSDTLQTGIVLRYPEELTEATDDELTNRLVHTKAIEYCVVTTDKDGNFPKSGYAKGSLSDIATAIHIGASPTKKIREVAKVYNKGMKKWAERIERSIKHRPVLGDMLSEIIGKDADVETCKTACMFIIDAFIFQDAVAGKPNFKKVRPLRHYDEPNKIVRHEGISRDWRLILQVNYVPIFKDALAILKIMREYDEDMARRVLKGLLATAIDICKSHLQQVHEIGGELFQDLVVDRDYVKAHYTLPESATLLSALVCPDINVDNLPKVADYACGTGALLNGVYKRIQQLYERKTGESSVHIHREMVEKNLAASDIYSHATHLTFTAMAATHPTTTLGQTRVITAPYGKCEYGSFKTGSLELLDSDQLELRTLGTLADKIIGDDDIATVDYKREFPHGEMDIVIINPPFAKNADANGKKAKAAFKAKKLSDDEEKLMRAALKTKSPRIANGNNGLGSWFVDMVDRKLKIGGTMGFILTATTLMGSSTKKLRRMLSEEYHDVIVVTIAQSGGYDRAFSHDTNMAECMVVATKGVGENTGRAKFVCLTERPDSLLTAQMLANLIRRQNVNRRLEDLPNGGDELRIGEQVAGYVLDSPIDEDEWAASNIRAFSLIQMGYRLREGRLHLPRMSESHTIPMCAIGDIADVGFSHSEIKDNTRGDGAFQVQEGTPTSGETYPALWKVVAETQRAMDTSVNASARILPGKEEKAYDILARKSQTHYHINLGFPANSMIASWTSEATIGVSSLTNVVLDDTRYEAAWTLWANSTLGLLCHWMSTSKQQAGRGRSSLGQLPSIATLDVRRLSTDQLAAADAIFAELKDARMLPYNECKADPWRHVLDARLLAEVLGITDPEPHQAMQNLREMLCAEPTIAGTKLEKNFCNLEEEREEFNLGGSADEDKKALQREQRTLRTLGIWLPA